jgi:hypothetical protein
VLIQASNGTLVTAGSAAGQVILDQRTFMGEFDSSFSTNNPGFNSLGAGNPNLPAGLESLPGGAGLGWDFWPMRIGNVASNLLYWDGVESDGVPALTDDDVRFGPPPALTYRFYMLNTGYYVDGTNAVVPGGVIGATGSDGSLHLHRYFSVNDGDGNPATDPAEGIYLVSLRLRMTGLDSSLPIYLLFGTQNASVEALDNAAAHWVEDRTDTLVLLGDYNKNGAVEAADYTVWRNSIGQIGIAGPADGDADGAIGRADYTVWKNNYGKSSPSLEGRTTAVLSVTVPEPSSATVLVILAMLLRRRVD